MSETKNSVPAAPDLDVTDMKVTDMDTTKKNAIELKNVTFRYEEGEVDVLKGLNFHVPYGDVALLSGYSGTGKSTVLSLICGIIPNITLGDIDGEVLIDGDDITEEPISYICTKVGIVLQNAEEQIIHNLVEDEIAFGCENFAFTPEEITQRIEESCAFMKLEKGWRTRTLSGGQKQRLMTAATLATKQKILVLDEPLANLDKEGAHLLMTVLRELAHERGYAVLVVEHRLDMVISYVDTVWNISDGKTTIITDKRAYLEQQTGIIPDSSTHTPTTEPLLDFEHAAFSAGNRDILTDISFEIKKGERILLLGENGCGKTTLMRMISRLNVPTGGVITQHIDPALGQKPKGSKEWFKKVGIVYQNPNYQLFMASVRDEIAFGAVSEEYVEEILDKFSLRYIEERHPHSLSEGQKRRVSIAAVVAAKPDLLLLDEPTVGQDYRGLMELLDIVNGLHNETGNTMITVTHDMRCAEGLCDRALLIQNGVIADEGGKDFVHNYFFANSGL